MKSQQAAASVELVEKLEAKIAELTTSRALMASAADAAKAELAEVRAQVDEATAELESKNAAIKAATAKLEELQANILEAAKTRLGRKSLDSYATLDTNTGAEVTPAMYDRTRQADALRRQATGHAAAAPPMGRDLAAMRNHR